MLVKILWFFRYFIRDKSSESLVNFFIMIYNSMLNLKILCNIFFKIPKKSTASFDNLTFIIQTPETSHCALRKNRKRGWYQAEEEQRSPGYPPEGFTKFAPASIVHFIFLNEVHVLDECSKKTAGFSLISTIFLAHPVISIGLCPYINTGHT